MQLFILFIGGVVTSGVSLNAKIVLTLKNIPAVSGNFCSWSQLLQFGQQPTV